MKVLFFGTGSIGKRHCINLKKLYPDAELFFFRESGKENAFSREMNAGIISHFSTITPDFSAAFICCPTYFRAAIYEKLISMNMPMYVEKPIASSMDMLIRLKVLLQEKNYTAPSLVGFNLRFLPIITKVKNIIEKNLLGNICRAHFEVGQYLPDWRQGVDYRKSYSAQKKMGGGVVLDLCHEVDLAHYLLGSFSHSVVISKKLSSLEIDSDDAGSIILYGKKNPIVSIDMDYISRKKLRYFRLIGDQASLFCDLMNNKLVIEGADEDTTISIKKEDFCVKTSFIEAVKYFLSSKIENKNNQLSLNRIIDMHKLLFNQPYFKGLN